MERKLKYNQYFTTGNILQYPQIVEFIENAKFEQVLDPFAGSGNLNILDTQFIGFDVDDALCKKYGWECNDSLINIPTQEKETLIITNPPYKAKNVCKRMGSDLYNYFINHENYTNLYQIGILNCLKSFENVIAIIPETFINSGLFEDRLYSVTIIEDKMFDDTDVPVCIACFNAGHNEDIKIYKNGEFLFTKSQLNKFSLKSSYDKKLIKFNSHNGNLGLYAVDLMNENIKFMSISELKEIYNINTISNSSRHITTIEVPVDVDEDFVNMCNILLNNWRDKTSDLLLSPFMGNNK